MPANNACPGISFKNSSFLFALRITLTQRSSVWDEVDTQGVRSENSLLERPLKPIAGIDADSLLEMTEASYIDLVQWTGEQPRADKRGKLRREEQSTPPAAIWNLANAPNQWVRQVQCTESHYYRVIGSAEALMAKAAELGQSWMKHKQCLSRNFRLEKVPPDLAAPAQFPRNE